MQQLSLPDNERSSCGTFSLLISLWHPIISRITLKLALTSLICLARV